MTNNLVKTLFIAATISLFFITLNRIHFRVQTTLIGYQIGELKKQEAKYRDQLNQLRTEFAEITTSKNLQKRLGIDAQSQEKVAKKPAKNKPKGTL